MSSAHRCKKCWEILTNDEERLEHEEKHKREEEENQAKEAMVDAWVVHFVIPKKLDEYKPDPDQEFDFQYIFEKHYKHIGKEEVLYFVTQMGLDINEFGFLEIHGKHVVYLLEKNAITEQIAAEWLDNKSYSAQEVICEELFEYFLENDFTIKLEWVAWLIENDKLMELVKAKFEFTFDEIYNAQREEQFDVFDRDNYHKFLFYERVHKHFPHSNYENPFADDEEGESDPFEEEEDLFDEYKSVSTEHVEDILHRRYWYDEEDDELSIVIENDRGNVSISIGKCKKMMDRDLQDLISEYRTAIDLYKEANEEVSKLFDKKEKIVEEINKELGEYSGYRGKEYRQDAFYLNSKWGGVMEHIYKDAIPERNDCANQVALLYFVISKK